MIKVEIYYVDGSMSDFQEGDEFISMLRRLERDGYKGKSLIDNLISDDWGVPPSGILLKGTMSNGVVIDENIRYD